MLVTVVDGVVIVRNSKWHIYIFWFSNGCFNGRGRFCLLATFDTNSNKVVVAFTDSNNSGYGTARVGTVSGTSISFGTAVVYTSAEANHEADSITFDSSNNRVVIAYTLSSGTNRGNAIVGTVSGTDISFGTQVAFNANFSGHQTATFDTSNNKVVIAFQDSSNSDQGTAVVGTVDPSDNSISFGSEAIFNAAGTDTISSTFDSTSNTVLIAYRDAGDSSRWSCNCTEQ